MKSTDHSKGQEEPLVYALNSGVTFDMRAKSVFETSDQMDKLIKENAILHKNKKSQQRVTNNMVKKLQRQVEHLTGACQELNTEVLVKDKVIQSLMIRLRVFLQKNFKSLPLEVFDEIEAIINGESNVKKPRKMAQTYKRMKEVELKYGGYDAIKPAINLSEQIQRQLENSSAME